MFSAYRGAGMKKADSFHVDNEVSMTRQLVSWGALTFALAAAACTGIVTDAGHDGATPGPGSGAGGGQALGGAGASGNAAQSDIASKLKLDGNPSYFRVVRLTNDQWTNSVQSVLGLATAPTLADAFLDAVAGTTDFTNNEQVLSVDSRTWSDYEGAAETLAAQLAADPAQLSKLYTGTDGAGFVATVGRRAYRRPLTDTEKASYQKLFDTGSALSGSQSAFAKGASLVLEAMLQSPYFLYRTELSAVGAPLSGFEMAAKLSLLFRNTTPNDALLDAAAGPGKLDTAEGAATVARSMLEEPAAKQVMRNFHGEFLRFKKFDELSKVGVPSYNPAINPELKESSFLFFDKIFSQGLGVKDIFLASSGFVGPNMAPLYEGGVSASASGLVEQPLGVNRVGYFTQLPFLVLYGHNAIPDSIHRGVSMALDVLCAPLGPPAANIPPLPATVPGQTNRMRVDAHTKGCGTICHNNMINPLGFAFENYDGMGQYRLTEKNGDQDLPIDSSASFAFVDGTKSYQNATELMKLMAADPQTHLCYSKKLASFALQRDIIAGDLPLVGQLASVSESGTGSVKQVLIDLVEQDAFRTHSGGAQ